MRPALIAALLMLVSAQAWALDRRIKLINESDEDIVEFHASNVARSNYEEDILGDRVVGSGESLVINLDDGSGYCKFDFMTVMRNGHKIVKRGVNICQLEVYRITN